jgi:hypothetical protein
MKKLNRKLFHPSLKKNEILYPLYYELYTIILRIYDSYFYYFRKQNHLLNLESFIAYFEDSLSMTIMSIRYVMCSISKQNKTK